MSLEAFGPIWDGAGARGMAKEGYWFHDFFPLTKRAFMRSTFVAKTITSRPNAGNMDLTADYRPAKRFPDCIWIDFPRGIVLNAVGLANPGMKAFLSTGKWQVIPEPFFLSFMPIGREEEQEGETREFVQTLAAELPRFKSKHVGLQLNLSCPNVSANLSAIRAKADKLLAVMSPLHRQKVSIVVKINLLVSPEEAKKIAQHPYCDGLCVANTIPYGELRRFIDWNRLFGDESPLARYGGGGLSGAPLTHLVAGWVRSFRSLDRHSYVNAGGGVMRWRDVDRLYEAGASSIFFASVAMLRPWRVPSIIERAHELFRK